MDEPEVPDNKDIELNKQETDLKDDVDLGSTGEDYKEKSADDYDRVDLGSDDDYIYVDHTNDESAF